jgi:ankyrin repeat protein/WD40 repeat protein
MDPRLILAAIVALSVAATWLPAVNSALQMALQAELVPQVGGQREPWSVAVSADGRYIVSAEQGGRVTILDRHTGDIVRTLLFADAGSSYVAVSPDSKVVAIYYGQPAKVYLYDIANWHLLHALDAFNQPGGVAFSPDGMTLAVADPMDGVSLWNWRTGLLLRSITCHSEAMGPGKILHFTKDGADLITGARGWMRKATFETWDVATGKLLATSDSDSEDASAGSAYGSRDRMPPDVARAIPANAVDLRTLAFSADGTSLFQIGVIRGASGTSHETGQVVEWDMRTGRLKTRSASRALDWSSTTLVAGLRYVASARYESLQVWDTRKGNTRTIINESDLTRVSASAISPDETIIAVTGYIEDWSKHVPHFGLRTSGEIPIDPSRPPPSFLDLYSLETGKKIRSLPNRRPGSFALAFTADGKRLMSASGETAVALWNVGTGALESEIRLPGALAADGISADGRVAMALRDDAAIFFDLKDRSELSEIDLGDVATAGVFSPDGRLLATSDDAGIIHVRDTSTGRERSTPHTDSHYVNPVFSPDGKSLACMDQTGAIQVWDTDTGKRRATLMVFGSGVDPSTSIHWLAYTTDGFYDGSDGVEKFLRWRMSGGLTTSPALITRFHSPAAVQTALTGRAQPDAYAALRRAGTLVRTDTSTDPGTGMARPTMPEFLEPVRTPLMTYSAAGNAAEVKKLIDGKADLNAVDGEGQSALILAGSRGHDDVIKLLLDAGADITDEDGHSLLPHRGDPAVLNAAFAAVFAPDHRANGVVVTEPVGRAYVLLFMGADARRRDKDGKTLLMHATPSLEHGAPLLAALLARGADVNAVDNDGETALVVAGHTQWLSAIPILLDHRADPNIADKDGWTPLLLAAMYNDTEVVHALLEHGANANAGVKPPDERTPLIFAMPGNIAMARDLLAHGANVNAEAGHHTSALSIAVGNRDATMVRLLLEHGANPDVTMWDGKTLFQYLHETDPEDKFGIAALLKGAAAMQGKTIPEGKKP